MNKIDFNDFRSDFAQIVEFLNQYGLNMSIYDHPESFTIEHITHDGKDNSKIFVLTNDSIEIHSVDNIRDPSIGVIPLIPNDIERCYNEIVDFIIQKFQLKEYFSNQLMMDKYEVVNKLK